MYQLVTLLLLLSLATACEDEPIVQASAPAKRKPKQKLVKEKDNSDLPPKVEFNEADFIETESSRDPFRSFAKVFIGENEGSVSAQHEVKVEEYAIADLKLVAIISGVKPAYAMLVDPEKLGHTVKRGEYIGRAVVMQPSGGVGAAYEVNWRIDQIRSEDIVLVRDDPSNPEVPSSTMVLPLAGEELPEIENQSEGVKDELKAIQKRLAEIAANEAGPERSSRRTRRPAGSDE